MTKYTVLILLLLGSAVNSFADCDSTKVPIQRQLVHDKINDEQKLLDKADGKMDGLIKVSSSDDINISVTDVMLRKVDQLQNCIEQNAKINSHNEKVRYLTYLGNMLRSFRINWKANKIKPVFAGELFSNFEKIMDATIDNESMVPLVDAVPYEVALINANIFVNNKGYEQSKNVVYLKFCALHPDKILETIAPFAGASFADSLITVAGKNDPGQLYKYAQDIYSPAGKLIARNTTPAVKNVADLSKLPSALLYFPFLDDIVSGKKQTDSLKKIIGDENTIRYDSVAYYKLLVKTEIEYSKRMMKGDTAIALFGPNGLRDVLQRKAIAHFINPINELHEKPENIRMKAIDPLSPIDIYYMLVMGESDIYTSSYKHSFNRMLQRMGKTPATDSLLLAVNFDYFKKFIKMAANFNKLDTFLNLMPASSAETLMKGFVGKLEATKSLEDAVDVADSYSSINNKKLLANILRYVNDNEQRCANSNNTRGKVIYNLLKTIFLSADSTNNIDLSAAIGIPPIYSIDNKALMDDSGRIVQQTFFYGDEDGRSYFPQYINSFSSKDWNINNNNKEWVEIKSIKGKNWIYVNRPLNSDKNLDDSAQVHLNNYLEKNGLTPSVVTHRGHSYWLPGTIKRMEGDAKIVLLGSCGGYKNLSQLIDRNPEAHIISTKEIGTGLINQVITNKVNQILLSGKSVIWKPTWAELTAYFSKQPKDIKEAWDDYIPPYKNLGAIFIKAYNRQTE